MHTQDILLTQVRCKHCSSRDCEDLTLSMNLSVRARLETLGTPYLYLNTPSDPSAPRQAPLPLLRPPRTAM